MATAQTTITEAMYTPDQLRAMQAQADQAVRRNEFEDFANQILMGAARGPTRTAPVSAFQGGGAAMPNPATMPPPTAIAGTRPQGSYSGPVQGSIGSLLSSLNPPQAPAGAHPNPVDGGSVGGGFNWGGLGDLLLEYGDDAAGVLTTLATGNPLLGTAVRGGVRGIGSLLRDDTAEGGASDAATGPDSGAPLFVDYSIEGDASQRMTEQELAARISPPTVDPRDRAAQLAQDSLYGTANAYDMAGGVLDATLGAGSGGQNVGNTYSGRANGAASLAEEWLAGFGLEPGTSDYWDIINYLVPRLMGKSPQDVLNTLTPNEVLRQIHLANQQRNA